MDLIANLSEMNLFLCISAVTLGGAILWALIIEFSSKEEEKEEGEEKHD